MKYSMLTARYSTTAILLLLQTADFGTGIDAVSIAASAMAIAVSGEMHFCSLADAASDCTPYNKSFVYTDADFKEAGSVFESTGLNKTLSNLRFPSTLFAPSSEAFTTYVNASNTTYAESISSRYNLIGSSLKIVPGQYYSVSASGRQSAAPGCPQVTAGAKVLLKQSNHQEVWCRVLMHSKMVNCCQPSTAAPSCQCGWRRPTTLDTSSFRAQVQLGLL